MSACLFSFHILLQLLVEAFGLHQMEYWRDQSGLSLIGCAFHDNSFVNSKSVSTARDRIILSIWYKCVDKTPGPFLKAFEDFSHCSMCACNCLVFFWPAFLYMLFHLTEILLQTDKKLCCLGWKFCSYQRANSIGNTYFQIHHYWSHWLEGI